MQGPQLPHSKCRKPMGTPSVRGYEPEPMPPGVDPRGGVRYTSDLVVCVSSARCARAQAAATASLQTNRIRTSKYYSVLDFIPRNLFSQFLRVANTYFLILIILQLVRSLLQHEDEHVAAGTLPRAPAAHTGCLACRFRPFHP